MGLLDASAAGLASAERRLLHGWEALADVWHDAPRQRFESSHVEPMRVAIATHRGAFEALASVVHRVERELR